MRDISYSSAAHTHLSIPRGSVRTQHSQQLFKLPHHLQSLILQLMISFIPPAQQHHLGYHTTTPSHTDPSQWALYGLTTSTAPHQPPALPSKPHPAAAGQLHPTSSATQPQLPSSYPPATPPHTCPAQGALCGPTTSAAPRQTPALPSEPSLADVSQLLHLPSLSPQR